MFGNQTPIAADGVTTDVSDTEANNLQTTAYGYNSEYTDASTGYQYLRARYYDPSTGTFLTQDSYLGNLMDPISQNRYTYGENDGINHADPSGHSILSKIKSSAKKAVSSVKKTAAKATKAVKKTAARATQAIKSKAAKAASAVKTATKKAATTVKKAASSAKSRVTAKVQTAKQKATKVASVAKSGYNKVKAYAAATPAQKTVMRKQAVQSVVKSVSSQVQKKYPTAYAKAKEIGSTAYKWAGSKLKEASSAANAASEALQNTYHKFCTTSNRIKNATVNFVKNVDWKKVAITGIAITASTVVVAATGGIAAPAVVSALGLTGGTFGAAVVTGAVTGAIGGSVYSAAYSSMSGNSLQQVASDTFEGAVTGAVTGGILAGVTYVAEPLINKVACVVTKNGCFIAGTEVLTAAGYQAIENIQAGDKVLAENVLTGEVEEKEVKQIFRHEVDTLVHLIANGEEIVTTPNHPFYVKDKGWINAGNLTEEDMLISADGEDVTISSISTEELEETVTVYNFEVDEYHTYFVGETEVLVHNSCQTTKISDPLTEKPSSRKLRWNMIKLKNIQPPKYRNAAHHIVAGTAEKAEEARAILKNYGIGINDASNGVFLPTSKEITTSTYHNTLHTYEYYDKVTNLVKRANSTEELKEILSSIAEKLSQGTFMK